MDPANPKPSMKRRITVAGSVGALAALAVVGAATMTGGPGESSGGSSQGWVALDGGAVLEGPNDRAWINKGIQIGYGTGGQTIDFYGLRMGRHGAVPYYESQIFFDSYGGPDILGNLSGSSFYWGIGGTSNPLELKIGIATGPGFDGWQDPQNLDVLIPNVVTSSVCFTGDAGCMTSAASGYDPTALHTSGFTSQTVQGDVRITGHVNCGVDGGSCVDNGAGSGGPAWTGSDAGGYTTATTLAVESDPSDGVNVKQVTNGCSGTVGFIHQSNCQSVGQDKIGTLAYSTKMGIGTTTYTPFTLFVNNGDVLYAGANASSNLTISRPLQAAKGVLISYNSGYGYTFQDNTIQMTAAPSFSQCANGQSPGWNGDAGVWGCK